MKTVEGVVVDGVVVAWHPDREGKSGGSGFIKASGPSLYLRERNIVTLGVETLRIGSRVRFQIGSPDEGFETPQAIEVEIYQTGETS